MTYCRCNKTTGDVGNEYSKLVFVLAVDADQHSILQDCVLGVKDRRATGTW